MKVHNHLGLFSPPLRGATAVKVLLTAVFVMLLSASALLAGSGSGQKDFTLQPSPSTKSVKQGESADFSILIKPTGGFTGTVTLSIAGLPSNSSAVFSPSAVAVGQSTSQVGLSVNTSSIAPGTYNLSVKGTSGAIQSAVVVIQLTVTTGPKIPLTISGGPSDLLAPGYIAPIDLQLTNSNKSSVAVTSLTVSIAGITRTPAAVAAGLTCTASNYVLSQFSGSYPFTLETGTTSLSRQGITSERWPQIRMLNTALNQDGCKGATVQLTYSGSGQGN